MTDHETKGTAKEIGGKIKEAAGNVTGDSKMKNDGAADQAKGKAEKNVGKVENAAKDQLD